MIILLFLSMAFAQSVSLEQAFKNEMTSLSNQQFNLSQSLITSKKSYLLEKKKLENEIIDLEKKVAETTLRNEIQSEQQKLASQGLRQAQQKKQSLQSTFKKAQILLDKTQNDLNFYSLHKPVVPVSDLIEVAKFQNVADQSLHLLRKSTVIEPILANYYSDDGELTSGELIRYGRIAATLKDSILAPSEKGLLQQVNVASQSPKMIELIIFDNLKSAHILKKTAGFWEFIADQIPILVLSMLMLLVLGLFSLFAKE